MRRTNAQANPFLVNLDECANVGKHFVEVFVGGKDNSVVFAAELDDDILLLGPVFGSRPSGLDNVIQQKKLILFESERAWTSWTCIGQNDRTSSGHSRMARARMNCTMASRHVSPYGFEHGRTRRGKISSFPRRSGGASANLESRCGTENPRIVEFLGVSRLLAL